MHLDVTYAAPEDGALSTMEFSVYAAARSLSEQKYRANAASSIQKVALVLQPRKKKRGQSSKLTKTQRALRTFRLQCLSHRDQTMPSQARVQDFIATIERGEFLEAIQEFYAEDMTAQENNLPPRVGR